jgi:protein-serine/threonine kinase
MGMVSEGPGEDVVTNEPVSYEAQIDQQFAALGSQFNNEGVSSENVHTDQYSGNHYTYQSTPNYYDNYNSTYDSLPRQSMQTGRSGRGVLQKNHRKFADAYEYERDFSNHSGSSGAARKVMDFFRRRAKSRAGDDR